MGILENVFSNLKRKWNFISKKRGMKMTELKINFGRKLSKKELGYYLQALQELFMDEEEKVEISWRERK